MRPDQSTRTVETLFAGLHSQAAELRVLLERQAGVLARSGSQMPVSILDLVSRIARGLDSLENSVLLRSQEVNRLRALVELGRVINSSLDITMVLNQVMDTIINLTGAERCFLMLRKDEGGLKFEIARNRSGETLEQKHFEVSQTIVEQVVSTARPILTTNAREDPRFVGQKSIMIYNLRSIMCVPLINRGVVMGVIYTDNRIQVGLFNESDLNILSAFADQAAVALNNATLFEELQKSKQDLEDAYDATLAGWAHALDLRDKETEGHTLRVTNLTEKFVRLLGFEEKEIVHVRRGALLHDIGKIGIPDRILNKPGPLDENEQEIMRLHPVYAYEMLNEIDYLRPAIDIPYCHHERWDGSGYPRGLSGENIPLAARIFSVIDIWDALTSDRPYRPAWNPDRVKIYLQEQAGKGLDPLFVEFFLSQQLA